MATQHLFTCPCGRQIAIEPRQAGEMLSCECGQSHRAPSMLQIRSLPSVHTFEKVRSFAWGPGHGLLFLGVLLLLLTSALLLIVFMLWPARRQIHTTPEQVRAYSNSLSPMKSIQFYREFIVSGISTGRADVDSEKDYGERVEQGKIGLFFVFLLALLSAAFIGSGIWLIRSRKVAGTRRVP